MEKTNPNPSQDRVEELREVLEKIGREAARGVHSKYRHNGDMALENVVRMSREALARIGRA